MTETFLILLAGGILLAAFVSSPKEVTLNWLRLAGILALALSGLALFFYFRREHPGGSSPAFQRRLLGQIIAVIVFTLAQLAFVQVAFRRTQRFFCLLAFLAAVSAGTGLLHEVMLPSGKANVFNNKLFSTVLQFLACAGVSAMAGLVLMDMLLGHAYLTASRMTIAPFRRLNFALIVTLILRCAIAIGGVLGIQRMLDDPNLWNIHGLFIITRWLVGLIVPAIFIYMAHDCIRRRSTQSATGILYVAGILVFIGEIVALHLVKETALPF